MLLFVSVKCNLVEGTFSFPLSLPFLHIYIIFKDRHSLKSILFPRMWAIELLLVIFINLIMCV